MAATVSVTRFFGAGPTEDAAIAQLGGILQPSRIPELSYQ